MKQFGGMKNGTRMNADLADLHGCCEANVFVLKYSEGSQLHINENYLSAKIRQIRVHHQFHSRFFA